MEKLNANLEKAYTETEFNELSDYFIAIECGKEIEDPRPGMSFITNEIERKSKHFAEFILIIIEVFFGKLEK